MMNLSPKRQGIRAGKRALRLAPSAALPLALLAVWKLSLLAGLLPSSIAADPAQVLSSGLKLLGNGALLHHSAVSLGRLGLGFFAGLLPALTLGTLVGYSRLGERVLAPTIALIAPVPVTAWIPMLIVIAGVGEVSKSGVIALGTFFPIYFGTVNGIRAADPRLVEVARIYAKGPFQTLAFVLLPSAIDSVFLGMRSALGLAWVLLIVAEVIASSDGIGWLMWDARNFARPAEMMVGMLTAGVLGTLTAAVLNRIRRAALFWKPDADELAWHKEGALS